VRAEASSTCQRPDARRGGIQGQKEEIMLIRSPVLQQIPVIGFTTTVVGRYAHEEERRPGASRAGAKCGHAIGDQYAHPNLVDLLAAVFITASVAFGPVMTWLVMG
jgi:hypothetical protein